MKRTGEMMSSSMASTSRWFRPPSVVETCRFSSQAKSTGTWASRIQRVGEKLGFSIQRLRKSLSPQRLIPEHFFIASLAKVGKCEQLLMDELCETEWGLRQKVVKLAKFLRASKHAVVHTGAGISTAAGIPDFRGPAGVWTLRAKGLVVAEPQLDKAMPTYTHLALKTLLDSGVIRHIVSQNIDALHIKSGIPVANLTELHGNVCLEVCHSCGAAYYRQFAVWSGLTVEDSSAHRGSDTSKLHNHRTGRTCENVGCEGHLVDNIVMFNEAIGVEVLSTASNEANLADLALVMGSSLRVKPACELPADVFAKGGRLVIVNLQRTPLDSRASLVIHADCDKVMKMLMRELQLETSGLGV